MRTLPLAVLTTLLIATPTAEVVAQTQPSGVQARALPRGEAPGPLNPGWQAGQSWRVRYSYEVPSKTKNPTPESVPITFDYTYTVGPATTDPDYPNTPIVEIAVSSDQGQSGWRLVFRRDELALIKIEKVDATATSIYRSPFSPNSWMLYADDFGGGIIHDFPRIPKLGVLNELVTPTQQGDTPFRQTIAYSGDGENFVMAATLRRTDPVTTEPHTTTLRWTSGEPWWSSASITLGDTMLITGELIRD